MIQFGQFCPISKAMEVLGERWSLLIVRELILGAERFADFERGLPTISPTMLNRRLNELAACGIVDKIREPGLRGHRYHLSQSGRELEPVLVALGSWGMRWARGQMSDDELDVHQLMSDIQRGCRPEQLPTDRRSVIHFYFSDLGSFNHWWLKMDADEVDLCQQPPGQDEHLRVTCTLRALTEIWMGDLDLDRAIRQSKLQLLGLKPYEKAFSRWLGRHRLADIRPAQAAII